MTDDSGSLPGGDPAGEGSSWTSWLPWVLLAVLGLVIIGALLFAQGDDDAAPETTTTAAETTLLG